MIRKVYLAADHGGFDLKEKIKKHLILLSTEYKITVEDMGPYDTASVDYPDYADQVCKKIHGFQLLNSHPAANAEIALPLECGFLICGSGQGMAMRANKYAHIRAALCWNQESAQLARSHNDANILCLGGRLIDHDLALKMCDIFLNTHFEGGRHQRRVSKVSAPLA